MFKPIRLAALLSGAALTLVAASASAQNELGDHSYINCEAGFAIEFPTAPMTRDIQYTTNTGRMVPARQFYVQSGPDFLQVTVARFNYGPPIDEAAMHHATDALIARGQVRNEERNAAYDPGYPGHQINVILPMDRQLRASVYMMDHKLYITEAIGPAGDPAGLRFEQSLSMVNAQGVDYDQNPPDPIRILPCRTGDFFRR